jgi:hypothetical protein
MLDLHCTLLIVVHSHNVVAGVREYSSGLYCHCHCHLSVDVMCSARMACQSWTPDA